MATAGWKAVIPACRFTARNWTGCENNFSDEIQVPTRQAINAGPPGPLQSAPDMSERPPKPDAIDLLAWPSAFEQDRSSSERIRLAVAKTERRLPFVRVCLLKLIGRATAAHAGTLKTFACATAW